MASNTKRVSSASSSRPKTLSKAWELSWRSASLPSRADKLTVCETALRVRYSETDAQGIVNNGVYLAYFEVGRVEWLRQAGFSYAQLERDGLGFVVVEANVRYVKPARFDDELIIKTTLSELGRVSLSFEYEVLRGGEVLTAGRTRHGCIDLVTGRPTRIPEGLSRFYEG